MLKVLYKHLRQILCFLFKFCRNYKEQAFKNYCKKFCIEGDIKQKT